MIAEKALGDSDRVKAALVHVFHATDKDLNMQTELNTDASGSTCVSVLIISNRLYCCNLGDSAAGIIFKGEGGLTLKKISREHLPDVNEEFNRVINCGGRIEPIKGRVD